MVKVETYKHDSNGFYAGYWVGILVCVVFYAFVEVVSYNLNPVSVLKPNDALNSPDYVIDTVKTINDGDTVETYKFKYIGDEK